MTIVVVYHDGDRVSACAFGRPEDVQGQGRGGSPGVENNNKANLKTGAGRNMRKAPSLSFADLLHPDVPTWKKKRFKKGNKT